MRRREFVTLLGAAAVWPSAVCAQKAPRTIGYLSPRSSGVEAQLLAEFRRGLRETGYVEDKNLAIEYRWAEGQYDRLPVLAADLASRKVEAIVTTGGPQPARAARAATQTVPLVFASGSDPLQDGLVKSLKRPGGNATGIHSFTTSLGPKRLQMLRELVPAAKLIGFLVNRTSQSAERQVRGIQDAARVLEQEVYVVKASTESELDLAFATLRQQAADALLMSADLFFQVHLDHLVELAARYGLPTMYEWPEFVAAGGLISYSTLRSETFFQLGTLTGRILNGADPADLPVQQSTRFELVINLKTAKALGLTMPQSILARADEVIE